MPVISKRGAGRKANFVIVLCIAALPECKNVLEIKHGMKASLSCLRCIAGKDTLQKYTPVRFCNFINVENVLKTFHVECEKLKKHLRMTHYLCI